MELRNVVALRFQFLQEPSETFTNSEFAKQANLFPADICVC